MRKNPGCANGPCNDSKFVGGPGCHLCDDISTLPQRGRGVVMEAIEDAMALSPEPAQTAAKKKSAPAPRRASRPKAGGLF